MELSFGNGHPVLQSVRIPLSAFGLAQGSRVRGVRLIFNRAAKGAIYLGNVRFTRPLDPDFDGGPKLVASPLLQSALPETPAASVAAIAPPTPRRLAAKLIAGGQVTRIVREKRQIASASQAIGSAKLAAAPLWPNARDVVTLTISVPERLVIGGSLLTLQIGDQSFRLGQAVPIASQGLKAARFYVPPAAFAALPDGAAMVLENGGQRFDLGKLNKALLQ